MKTCFKSLLNIFAFVAVLPFYVFYSLSSLCCDDRKVFPFYSQYLSLAPGVFGAYLRRAFYKLTLDKCADDVWISFGTIFSTSKVSLGRHVYIGQYCLIGEASIDDNTIVASRVSITSGLKQHGIESLDVPIREQQGSFEKISIANDCWIGEGAIIAANIAEKVVVGAGSVVVKDVKPLVVIAGNPAAVIKERVAIEEQASV